MAVLAVSHFAKHCWRHVASPAASLRLAVKLAAAASVCVVIVAVYAGAVVSRHVRENAVQAAAVAAAMYMDSFVASHVHELATSYTLSNENRSKLERLLSPASMHRPVVAFRIWKGDTVVFSNERELIGKTFSRNEARQRAVDGHIGVDFERPDGDDDEHVRALNVPILEVYAPVREKGTGRIIALAETYEIAVGLASDVRFNQMATWGSVAVIAITLIALLFYMAGVGQIERDLLLDRIGELSRLRAEAEQRRRRITHANMRLTEVNEQSLRRVETDLQHGPVQNVALALLKLDPLRWVDSGDAPSTMPNPQSTAEIECVRKRLVDTINQMRGVCADAVPARVAELAAGETLASAVREHHRHSGMTVKYDFANVPEQLPLSLKACLYRIVLEGLRSAATGTQSQSVRAALAGTTIAIEIVGGTAGKDNQAKLAGLRDRIEALGGMLNVSSTPTGDLLLIAELDLTEMGISVG